MRFGKVILYWLFNNIDAKLKTSVKGASQTPTIANERGDAIMEVA